MVRLGSGKTRDHAAGGCQPRGRHAKGFFFKSIGIMQTNFECLEMISNMFHAWCMKSSFHEHMLRERADEMMLLVPRPFMYILMNEIHELSADMPPLERSFMFVKTSFTYPIHVTRHDENGEPLLRINGILILASFDMSLHLYHVETTERLDDWLRVSVPLMPGFKLDDRFPGTSAVMFKMDQALPLFPFDSSAKNLLN